MAENEVLDVGNPRHYQRWRRALADANLSPSEIADCLFEGLSSVLRKKLRGKPLYLVLKACGPDREALQEAVVNFKDRAMAKWVEQAYAITRSNDPLVVAGKIAELLVDRLVDRANRHAFKHDNNADGVRHASLERAASARLETCKPEIVGLLAASLRGEPIRRMRKAPTAKPSVNSLLSKSLRRPETKRPSEPPHA
jgi:hypothetical protein